MGLNPIAVTYTSDMAPAVSKEFFDIYTIGCRFTLKLVRDIIITYSIMAPMKDFASLIYTEMSMKTYKVSKRHF